ncbi:MAG: hypothetical protein J6O41_02085 [Clostridia bacterium]|nr:hypothetical protein [Clostridia bacterium]
MLKQFFINRYFHKLCKEKFFKNDEERVIGSARDVIKMLQGNIEYAKTNKNDIGEEWSDYIISESTSLINEINEKYKKQNNIVGLFNNPMSGYFVLQEKNSLYEDLKEYYDELEEN